MIYDKEYKDFVLKLIYQVATLTGIIAAVLEIICVYCLIQKITTTLCLIIIPILAIIMAYCFNRQALKAAFNEFGDELLSDPVIQAYWAEYKNSKDYK